MRIPAALRAKNDGYGTRFPHPPRSFAEKTPFAGKNAPFAQRKAPNGPIEAPEPCHKRKKPDAAAKFLTKPPRLFEAFHSALSKPFAPPRGIHSKQLRRKVSIYQGKRKQSRASAETASNRPASVIHRRFACEKNLGVGDDGDGATTGASPRNGRKPNEIRDNRPSHTQSNRP
ncbi:MAG: hypothetical protein Q4B35_03670 [Slackia sp.]|nr:hypothetical protein [Slackia sp.]